MCSSSSFNQFLPREPENSQPDHVFIKKRLRHLQAVVRREDRKAVPAGRLLLGRGQHQDVRGLPAAVPAQRLRRDRPPRRHLTGLALSLRRPGTVLRPRPNSSSRCTAQSVRTPPNPSTRRPIPIRHSLHEPGGRATGNHATRPRAAPFPHGQRHAPRHDGGTTRRGDRGRFTVGHRRQERRGEPSNPTSAGVAERPAAARRVRPAAS